MHLLSGRRVPAAILAFLLLTVSAAYGDEPVTGASLRFDPEPIDLGAVDRGETIVHEIMVENVGGEPLEIRNVYATCPCATATGAGQLEPGAKGAITVTIETVGLEGKGGTDITFETNDPSAPHVVLVLVAEIQVSLDVNPPRNRFLAVQGEGSGLVKNRITARDGVSFELVSVESPYDFLEVSFQEVATDDRDPKFEGSQWDILTAFPSDAPVGPLGGSIRIATDHPREKRIDIPISGFVRPMHQLSPPSTHFGELKLDRPKRSPFWFDVFTTEPVVLHEVTTDVPGVVIELEPVKDGRKYKVVLNFTQEMTPGPFSGSLHFRTDSGKFPSLTYPLTGAVVVTESESESESAER